MPPRKATSSTGPAGKGKAAAKPVSFSLRDREGGSSRGSAPGGASRSAAPLIPDHITTVCVKRKAYGTAGQAIEILTNSFAMTLEPSKICHYDVVVEPKCAARINLALFSVLQDSEPNIFTPKIVYDGQKNAFAPRELDLGDSNSRKFAVSLSPSNPQGGRPPRIYNITLTLVASLNSEVLERFINRKMSLDNDVLTTLTALNTAMRMGPNLAHTHNKRAFYTDTGRVQVGGGFEAWRGIFQSVRPTFGRLILNIDLSSALVYKEGPLIDLCTEFLGRPFNALTSALPPRDRHRLERFIFGIRITVNATTGPARARTISGLSTQGANAIMFTTRAGQTLSVANYFHQATNSPLRHPDLLCVTVGNAEIPLECCFVVPGQIIKKGQPVGDNEQRNLLDFATLPPSQKLKLIKEGQSNIQAGLSDYVAQFGMNVADEPLKIQARVLEPPCLQYGGSGAHSSQTPRDGAWNMAKKTFIKPASISSWVVAIFEQERNFGRGLHKRLVDDFLKACENVGIKVAKKAPIIAYLDPQNVEAEIRKLGRDAWTQNKELPSLIVVILPFYGNEVWRTVKNFGDMKAGVATQCLKANKCTRATDQFWGNVMLKINGKLGGVNLELKGNSFLSDPKKFTIVLGADVVHPPPANQSRPSFAALVASTNVGASSYVATLSVQEARHEMIADLKQMCKDVLGDNRPARLIFYRDGVSEGEFQKVKDQELPMIKDACTELGFNPTLTALIVRKRHHNQLFPKENSKDKDKSGNIPAGTVVDRDITHPIDSDFFLQSHAGIKGTSRCGHYTLLHDENDFTEDAIQRLSFDLCHLYGPSTRSVSIPAPIYYADRVCTRAKTHFDTDFADASTDVSGTTFNIGSFKDSFQRVQDAQRGRMYFN